MNYFDSMCLCCNDKNHYRVTISQVQQKNHYLQRLLNIQYVNMDIKNSQLFFEMMSENQHPHFMCGTCRHINLNDLINEEKKLKHLLIAYIEKTKEDSIYYNKRHEVLSLLQGDYPCLYRILERELSILKSTKDITVSDIIKGQILHVVLPDNSIKETKVIDIIKVYEKWQSPNRYLDIYTQYLDSKTDGMVVFRPEDFEKIIFYSEEKAKEKINKIIRR